MNILNNNGKYSFYNNLTIDNTLKTKNYLFNYDDLGNCWLEDIEDFKFPDKVYDVNANLRSLISTSYTKNKRNLGVLLTGNKGQGKSLTAKYICTEANVPIIVINKRIPVYINLVKFFNDIKQDYVLFIDEFEKLFNSSEYNSDGDGGSSESKYHSQQTFLSFMDGVFTNDNKILFLLTSNDSVNEYLINRPSRIKFLQEYNELPEELFNMIVEDKLINQEYRKDLEENTSMINMNIDLLVSIIDDINLFDKPFSSFMSHYNYKFENYRYEVNTIKEGHESWEKFINSDRKFKATDRYIGGYYVDELVKFTKDEIVFTANDTIYDENRNAVTVLSTIKLTPTKTNFKSNTF